MIIDPLGDGISEVEFLDSMGDDLTVVNSARVSFHKVSLEVSFADKKLIHYLAEHKHWTPFAHVMLQFRIKMPLFVAREWYRHEVGLVRNEVSRRYVTEDPEYFIPKEWRMKPEGGVKQGSGGIHADSHDIYARVNYHIAGADGMYQELVNIGVAPEMARMVLPQSMYTEFIETGSLAAYARIASLRIAPDAQKETRLYAEAVAERCLSVAPVSWEALCQKTK